MRGALRPIMTMAESERIRLLVVSPASPLPSCSGIAPAIDSTFLWHSSAGVNSESERLCLGSPRRRLPSSLLTTALLLLMLARRATTLFSTLVPSPRTVALASTTVLASALLIAKPSIRTGTLGSFHSSPLQMASKQYPTHLTEQEWRMKLSPEQFRVRRPPTSSSSSTVARS